jgi:hypothetical protein
MRTKALFVAAAFVAAGIVSSMAQVYSDNVVGYVNATMVPGFNLITNPLDAGDNTVQALLPGEPGLKVYKFRANQTGYDIAEFVEFLGETLWQGPNFEIAPGEGVFVLNPLAENLVVTFVGEIQDGMQTISVPEGFSIRSSIVPQAGALASQLAFPAVPTDLIYKWNKTTQSWTDGIFTLQEFLGEVMWSPSEPSLEVGEAFFVKKAGTVNWDRDFAVGP